MSAVIEDFDAIGQRARALRCEGQCAVRASKPLTDCWCYQMAVDPVTGNYTGAHLPCPNAAPSPSRPTLDEEIAAAIKSRGGAPFWSTKYSVA